ncbi:gamma-butyrobetaine hydroxylase-like domain-containing protein [Agaribacterium haliotis]|uniref:gamma-butyrobetaine hydroxylase-like domain-containing protein n=1 Tax=Agaribacterium haliotis TaxID=2013869 RepID=UPI000BB54B88|nr:DUF971 domain-containing protein [Agaribacterium haliotis]
MKPTQIKLSNESQQLELRYGTETFTLSAELLRVLSPSAEVQGHGPDQKKVPLDKQSVRITGIERQGNYALRLSFDDGHDTGIYSWPYFRELCLKQDELWEEYLEEAKQRRLELDGVQPLKWQP